MTTKYKSEHFEAIHEMASDLFALGVIDTTQLREFDEDCLVPVTPPVSEPLKHDRMTAEPAYTHA
jgi:putative transcriptional regulator